MLRALQFNDSNLEIIAKESGAPIEEVESQWQNILKYGHSYIAVLGAQDWDGSEIPWIWCPGDELREKIEFVSEEKDDEFTEFVFKK